MNKQFFTTLSSKTAKLFKYLEKERMIPPQNWTRYTASGVVCISTYLTLDDLTKSYPVNGETVRVTDTTNDEIINIKGYSSNNSRILENAIHSGALGIITWYAPYIMGSLILYHNINTYIDDLKYYSKYLKVKENK